MVKYKELADNLWKLLDDISTAGDMFKPTDNSYVRYVNKKVEERHKYLESDGYKLYVPGEMPKKHIKSSDRYDEQV